MAEFNTVAVGDKLQPVTFRLQPWQEDTVRTGKVFSRTSVLITLNWLLVNFEQLNESSLIVNHRAQILSSDVTKSFPRDQNNGYACNKAISHCTYLLSNVTAASR